MSAPRPGLYGPAVEGRPDGTGAFFRPEVLVIDDNDRMRSGLIRALQRHASLGTVNGASDGEEGLRMALAQRPRVLLTDHRLPSISGLEIARALFQAPSGSRTTVVLMTASPDDELRGAAEALGVFALVDKASDRRAICEAVVQASFTGLG